MDISDILKKVDHTLLGVDSSWEDVKLILDDAKKFNTASACIAPSFVKRAKEYVGDEVKICTVIGFPNGYNSTKAKVFEAQDAIDNGADEIDMVINIGELKAGNTDYAENEVKELRKVCRDKILKVIIETCLLTDDEKIEMCRIVTNAKVDYIKTSTGFSKSGATFHDVELFAKHCEGKCKIKAAGGIRTREDMEKFIELGADRLGTSSAIKILYGTK